MAFKKWLMRGLITCVALGTYLFFGLDEYVKDLLGGDYWGTVLAIFVVWFTSSVVGYWITRGMDEH